MWHSSPSYPLLLVKPKLSLCLLNTTLWRRIHCLIKHQTMKKYWGSGSTAPQTLSRGIRLRWVVSFTPRSLYLWGKSPWYISDQRFNGTHRRFWSTYTTIVIWNMPQPPFWYCWRQLMKKLEDEVSKSLFQWQRSRLHS